MKIDRIKDIEFFNREKEKEQIVNILKFNPRLITFIYGPINSGKTSLIMNLIEDLPDDYVAFYVNLRGKFISDYNDFVQSLFEVDRESKNKKRKISEFTKGFLSSAGRYYGIPIAENLLDGVFKDNEPKNVFEYITEVMNEVKKNKKQPILIIDELQVIGDLKIDDYLIYKIFNFFIRLTKELHLCHVFALSSDSLFIEKVYGEAMLQERCKYLLVDEFDKQTTKEFLGKYGITEFEGEVVWNHAGGKPGHLIEIISAKETGKGIESVAKETIENEKNTLLFMLAKNREKKGEIMKIFKKFKHEYEIKFDEDVNFEILKFLIKKNILFIDAIKKSIKTQSKTELISIREILKEMS